MLTAATQTEANTRWSTVREHGITERLATLKFRWLDEKEYEDFADYKKNFESLLTEHGYRFLSLSKTFTAVFSKDGFRYEIKVYATGKVTGRITKD